MKKIKLFFALFAMLALGVGNAWGAEATLSSISTKNVVTTKGQSVSTTFDGVTCTVTRNSGNQPEFYTSSGIVRYYSSDVMKLSVASGNVITKIVFTMNSGTVGTANPTGLSSDSKTWTGSAESVSFTASATVKISTIVVTYEASGSTEPVLSATPTEIDFGTVYQGTTVEDKTVAVNFENLTGAVTYSGLSTPFTATGAISATGDKITISADASTIGGHSQILKIQSAADSKTAEVTVKMNVEAPFNGKKLGFDFVNHPTGWPVKSNATAGEYVYNLDDTDYTFKHSKSGDGVYVAGTSGTSGYLLIASGNTLGLPAIKGHKLVKVQGTLNNSGSPSTSASVSITDGTNTLSGGTAQTWNTKGGIYTYSLSGTQANTMYYLSVSNKNLQMITLVLYYEECEKYALTITEPTEGGTLVVKDGENTLTSGAEIYEGTKLTVTATPETGYEDGVVVVKNASDEDITATVYADGVLTMPAYAVTISATFEKKPCELLAKPTVSATTTYSSATLTWEAVANAAKYSVKVGTADAVETTATSYEVTGLNAETEYTYQVQAIAEAGQDTYCDSEVAEGTFTTATAPTATLTLSDIEGTTTKTGALNGTITLPTTAAECSKTFVGWDADENCDHAPTYAPGAEYTLAAETQTLYAVYADGENGEAVTIFSETFDGCIGKGANGDEAWSGTGIAAATLTLEGWTFEKGNAANGCAKFGSSSAKGSAETPAIAITGNATLSFRAGAWDNSSEVTTLNLSATGANLSQASVTLTKAAWTEYTIYITEATGSVKIKFEASIKDKNRFFLDDVVISQASVTYSNYSTTCAAALEKPTFSVVEGTYTEAKSIELNATEGDIYYTLDGTEPTALSTPYTAAIDLDECGTTTINAIAISTESQSPVASATYTINLPITNTAATAYTPAEAIAIIDGDCDKTEEVFVKGVVVSTSDFSAEYGNYDVIVKAIDDNSANPTTFTFYRMYKAASKTKFTASDEVIGVGDIITAKGVLKKYNSTYELADGCYMVEREAFTEPKTDISNTLETAYTVDKAFELISDVKSDLDKEVYVKGLVAVASTQLYEEKYLTYSISDNGQTTGNTLKVYDGLNIGGVAFTSKDDVKVGDYVVVKGKLLNYGGTYEINKDNQLVQHKKAATITIADITMEVGETKTIAATITPAAAKTAVVYEIKENTANAISLSGNTISADAVGTATITATIATAADYMGNSVDFTVNVTPKSASDEVVILAEHNGQWYALKAEDLNGDKKILAALAVTYLNGKLYNVNETDKASITWTRTIVGDQVTFKNGTNYLYVANPTKTELSLNATAFSWTYDAVLDTYTSNDGKRTFLYGSEANGFKNFAINNNVGTKNYSGYPVVTAPVYATADLILGDVNDGATVEAHNGQVVDVVVKRSLTANDGWYTLCLPFNLPQAQLSKIGKAYTIPTDASKYTCKDGVITVNVEQVTQLNARMPYLIMPTANIEGFVAENVTIAYEDGSEGVVNIYGISDGNGADYNFSMTSELYVGGTERTNGLYWVGNGGYLYNNDVQKLALRAYFSITQAGGNGMPPRFRVVAGENVETGVGNIISGENTAIKVIENGQLIIIREGVKYNVQGQKL